MLSDIEIARNPAACPIARIAAGLGLQEDDYELYGKYIAKLKPVRSPRRGRLILICGTVISGNVIFFKKSRKNCRRKI